MITCILVENVNHRVQKLVFDDNTFIPFVKVMQHILKLIFLASEDDAHFWLLLLPSELSKTNKRYCKLKTFSVTEARASPPLQFKSARGWQRREKIHTFDSFPLVCRLPNCITTVCMLHQKARQ